VFGTGSGLGCGFGIVDEIVGDVEEGCPVTFCKGRLDVRFPGTVVVWVEGWELLVRVGIGDCRCRGFGLGLVYGSG
jgi:hypothetical protein